MKPPLVDPFFILTPPLLSTVNEFNTPSEVILV